MKRLAVVLSVLLMPLAAAQSVITYPGIEVPFFLHATGGCDAQNAPKLFMDLADSGGDQDGCGEVGFAPSGFDLSFAASVASNLTVPKDYTATSMVFVSAPAADTLQVAHSIKLGNASCGGSSPEQTVLANEWKLFVFSCKFNQGAAPTTKPTLDLVISARTGYGMGYEGSHASRLIIRGERLNATTGPNETSPAPGGGAAGFLGPVAIGATLAAACWRRRHGL